MDTNRKQGMKSLDPADLEQVIGGADTGNAKGKSNTKVLYCDNPKCKQDRVFILGSGGRAFCSFCNTGKFY